MGPEPGQTELFNWSYPPFWADAALFCQRDAVLLAQWRENAAASLGPYPWGQEMRPRQALNLSLFLRPIPPTPVFPPLNHSVYLPLLRQPSGIILSGWSPESAGFSWSKCPQATIYLHLGDVEPEQMYRLIWQGATLGEQKITVRVNETVLETFTDQIPLTQPAERIWLIPGSVLQNHQLNSITFDLPNAHPADELDNRLLALAFFSLRLEKATELRPRP